MEIMQLKEEQSDVKIHETAEPYVPQFMQKYDKEKEKETKEKHHGLLDKLPRRNSSAKGGSIGKGDSTKGDSLKVGADEEKKSGSFRNWNKKIIYDLQDTSK
jgi:hypothetical protein